MTTNKLLKRIVRSLALVAALACGLSAQGDFGYVITGNSTNIHQINLKSRTISASIPTGNYTTSGALNQRGSKLWMSAGSSFYVVNTATKSVVYQSPSFAMTLTKPVFSRDGSKVYLLTASSPTTLTIFDTTTYTGTSSISLTSTSVPRSSPVLSSDGNRLYFIDNNSYLNEVNTATFAVRRTSLSSSSYNSIKFSPDDSLLFLWGANQYSYQIQVMKASTLTSVNTITASSYVTTLECSRDGKLLFVALTSTSQLQKFDLSSSPPISTTTIALNNPCTDLAVDPSDSLLYVAYGNSYSSNNIGVYNFRTAQAVAVLSVPSYPASLIMPMRKDTIAPSSISNFKAQVLAYHSVRLTFTSPGNDGALGRAAFYDVRYDTVQITDASFPKAKKATGLRSPQSAGKADTLDITGLQGSTTYYFAIKAGDEVLNLSPTAATASAHTPAPARLEYQLDAIPRVVKDNDSLTLALKIHNAGDADLVYGVSMLSIAKNDLLAPASALGKRSDAARSSRASLSSVSVLMVFSGSTGAAVDVQQKLMNQGGFSKVDIFYASSNTPTLDLLKVYDVVFVWANNYFYSPSALGNVLADFVDAGGSVVTAIFSLSIGSSYSIQGRFNAENYWAITPGIIAGSSRATLGVVKNPSHPIMKGVKTFDGGYSGSYGSYRILGGGISTGASLIASWSDGSALVAVRRIKGTNRVDLGFEPVSSDVYPECWVSTTDGAKLMANALKYSAASYGATAEGEANVSFSADSGSVRRGETKTVTVTLKTKNCLPGDYTMTIAMESNDPDSSSVEAGVNFSVHDVTPPKLGIRFFQNEAFPQNISIVSIAHEKLYSPLVKAGVDGQSVPQPLALLDTTNFVYSVNYTLSKSGMFSVQYDASDSLGNHSLTTRQLSVLHVSSASAARIVSADEQASLQLHANAIGAPVFVTASVDDGSSDDALPDAIGPVYRFGPRSITLLAPAEITMSFAELPAAVPTDHLGIYAKNDRGEWLYLPTRIDAKNKTLHARVAALGEFRIQDDPSIEPEAYVEPVPDVFALEQNYPNPFNPSTVITYRLPAAGHVVLKVYDAIGREAATLVNEMKQAGSYSVTFNASKLASGIYIARLQSGGNVQMKKLVLIK